MKKTVIHYHSLDADGCLLPRYEANQDPFDPKSQMVLEANTKLIHHIAECAADHTTENTQVALKFMVGSLRQDVLKDIYNASQNKNGSIFAAIMQLAEACQGEIDEYLLYDSICENQQPKTIGAHFQEAKNRLTKHAYLSFEDKPLYAENYSLHFNDPKIVLVYAQMHRAASRFPNVPIYFHFYDDCSIVWNSLSIFYSKNMHLIPQNVVARFYHYSCKEHYQSGEICLIKEIKGKGKLNERFHEIIETLQLAFNDAKQKANIKAEKEGFIIASLKDIVEAASIAFATCLHTQDTTVSILNLVSKDSSNPENLQENNKR